MSNSQEKILPTVSIVIPTYKRAQDIERLLNSLVSEITGGIEVIVVDDASPDPRIFDSVKELFPNTLFIHSSVNQGPGRSRNLGAQKANSDIILFLDSDTTLCKGSILALKSFFAENPKYEVLCGWDDLIPLNSGFFARFKAIFQVSVAPTCGQEVSFVAGRCFAIKRQLMISSAGFDTVYKSAEVEDYEFGRRLVSQGNSIWFLPEMRVQHDYPSFYNQAVLYFKRVVLWMELQPNSEGAFDNSLGTRRRDALITIFSAIFPWTFISLNWLWPSFFPILISITAITLNAKFLKMCYKEEGLWFLIKAIFCHSFLSLVICIGGAHSLITKPVWKKLKLMYYPTPKG
ncbi:glycosyltransferase [Bacteriovoracales bacterium]|nr:glycosyltransferase [Bacteriovoracales bacterium]